MNKPKLGDFYDDSDLKGVIYGDTLITGLELTLKDGSKQYQKINPPFIYITAEESNKK